MLYAEREIDVAQHEQKTAAALLESVEDHVKAGEAPVGLPGQVDAGQGVEEGLVVVPMNSPLVLPPAPMFATARSR